MSDENTEERIYLFYCSVCGCETTHKLRVEPQEYIDREYYVCQVCGYEKRVEYIP